MGSVTFTGGQARRRRGWGDGDFTLFAPVNGGGWDAPEGRVGRDVVDATRGGQM